MGFDVRIKTLNRARRPRACLDLIESRDSGFARIVIQDAGWAEAGLHGSTLFDGFA
jgi:hypothetical protein